MTNLSLETIIENLSSRSQVKEFFQHHGRVRKIKKGFYFPDFSCFNSEFVLQVLNGTKFLLKLTQANPIYLPNYHITNELGKEKLIEICVCDQQLILFLPDVDDLSDITRDFLLSLIYSIAPNIWQKLVEKYKIIENYNHQNKYNIYQAKVAHEWVDKIGSFVPNKMLKKRGKFFRYKISQIVNSKYGQWDGLTKQQRQEIKKKEINTILNKNQEIRINNNMNFEMKDESEVKRRNCIQIEEDMQFNQTGIK